MRFFVESYGCTMNRGEGRELAGDLSSLGFEPTASAEEADVVVLNTCTVVETTEKHMLSRISELRAQGKEVVVTGCMAKAQPGRVEIRLPDAPIIPPEEYLSPRDAWGTAPIASPKSPEGICTAIRRRSSSGNTIRS